MMLVRMYETIFITRPDLEADVIEKLHQRLLKALESIGGVELKLADWGKRKLAYEIDRQKKGNYWYFGYISKPAYVAECERQLKLSVDVLRFQTVVLSKLEQLPTFDLEIERKRVESLTPEREEDEEEQYLRRSMSGRRDDDDDGPMDDEVRG